MCRPSPRLIEVDRSQGIQVEPRRPYNGFAAARACKAAFKEIVNRGGYKSHFTAQLSNTWIDRHPAAQEKLFSRSCYFKPGFDMLVFDSRHALEHFVHKENGAGLAGCGIMTIALSLDRDPARGDSIDDSESRIIYYAARKFATLERVVFFFSDDEYAEGYAGMDKKVASESACRKVATHHAFMKGLWEKNGMEPKYRMPELYDWMAEGVFRKEFQDL